MERAVYTSHAELRLKVRGVGNTLHSNQGGPIKDTVEAGDEIFVEIAEDEIAGIEIWNASKYFRADRERTFGKN
jgi:uncharacterized protein YuzE